MQKELSRIETKLQAARQVYNDEVTSYNTVIESIPSNIVASMFTFKRAELFQIKEHKKENIRLGF